MSQYLRNRVTKLEERLLPLPDTGPSVAEILRRRGPGEPRPTPPTEEEMAKTPLGRLMLARLKATERTP